MGSSFASIADVLDSGEGYGREPLSRSERVPGFRFHSSTEITKREISTQILDAPDLETDVGIPLNEVKKSLRQKTREALLQPVYTPPPQIEQRAFDPEDSHPTRIGALIGRKKDEDPGFVLVPIADDVSEQLADVTADDDGWNDREQMIHRAHGGSQRDDTVPPTHVRANAHAPRLPTEAIRPLPKPSASIIPETAVFSAQQLRAQAALQPRLHATLPTSQPDQTLPIPFSLPAERPKRRAPRVAYEVLAIVSATALILGGVLWAVSG